MKLSARSVGVEIGGQRVVEDASLELRAGEIVGLIGPNGAGKSSLLRAIVGTRPRSAGSVWLGEQRIETLPAAERARRIAYLPQERRVEWRLSVEDVVMLGRFPHETALSGSAETSHRAVERALGRVDALALKHRAASALSGGELARVLLARALAVEAPTLLADEPTAALDPYHQLQVMEILRDEARGGAGVLVVLQDLALAARFMDRLVLMSDGTVVAEGQPAQVLTPETLAVVYGVAAVMGSEGGDPYVIPWTRLRGP